MSTTPVASALNTFSGIANDCGRMFGRSKAVHMTAGHDEVRRPVPNQ
jgi:hypothetical protein